MEKAGGQEQQPLMWQDKDSSWPSGAARAWRADVGAGRLEEAANWWGGRAPWSLPGGMGRGPWAPPSWSPPTPLHPCSGRASSPCSPPSRWRKGSPIHISETRWAQKRQRGDFTGSAFVPTCVAGVCVFINGEDSLPGSSDADGHQCTSQIVSVRMRASLNTVRVCVCARRREKRRE